MTRLSPFSRMSRRSLIAAGLLAASTLATAQTKPITLLVPFPAGGATDQLARAVAQKLTEQKGYSIVVENKPGAGAQVAINSLKLAPADGNTLFIGDIGAFSLNRHLYQKLSYDTERDLQPITLVGKAPLFLVVPSNSPYKTAADLVAAGKAKDLSYGSPGMGTIAHVGAEMLRAKTGMKITHIPYRGSAPALVDLAAGQIPFALDPLASSTPFLKDGRLRALAVSTATRTKLMPDLPTLAESGATGVSFAAWFGIAAKAGTPAELVRKYSKDIGEVASAPDMVKRFADLGIEMAPTTPEGFAQFIKAEADAYGPIIQSLKISLD
ncbi:MAG: tripartite tricarboxylate transporter substrate binding protein [Burkholderiaceae bacterium]|nr:tripartite tricarboxylate transporter substrate binding protein [Burkholderiaceae bacterium]